MTVSGNPPGSGEIIFPKRTIHLDFHTGPWAPGVGKDFDPDRFAHTFKVAHVDSVTVFAKCHHGQLYYATDRPERHPGLPEGLDLLSEQIKALHAVGIRAPIYMSVQCDEYAANTHPEWIALTPELQQVKGGESPFKPAWQILDMSSPYRDFLADQVQEVLDRFAPLDGLFLDMCWDQVSCSKWALQGMLQSGLDPEQPGDRRQYARSVTHGYMERFRDMVERAHTDSPPAGIWFNSRPKTHLHIEKKFLRHVEIECLPTGGWGYAFFPYVSRFVRSVADLPTLSHTGRFFKSWGDNASLKPEMALKYECCQILSQGMTCGVGDLLHPTGVPAPAVYDLIGRVYSYIESCEPYVADARVVSDIAVVVDPALGDQPGASGIGAVRALQQLRHQFDIIPPGHVVDGYKLVVIPETIRIDAAFGEQIQSYLHAGGALIVSGNAALDEEGGPALPELGIETHGQSPYTHTFLHAVPEVSEGLADYGYVMYEQGFRMTPASGAQTLVRIGEPYFQRSYQHFSGHEYTPEGKLSEYAAVVRSGRVITFSVPILAAYGKHASPNYRTLRGNCIRLLLPDPILQAGGPTKLETTVMRRGNTTIVHLMSFSPERRAEGLDIVEDAIPLVDTPVQVRSDCQPHRVFLAPDERELHFTYEAGVVHTRVTVLSGHALLVLEA